MRPRPSDDPVMIIRATAAPPLIPPTGSGLRPKLPFEVGCRFEQSAIFVRASTRLSFRFIRGGATPIIRTTSRAGDATASNLV